MALITRRFIRNSDVLIGSEISRNFADIVIDIDKNEETLIKCGRQYSGEIVLGAYTINVYSESFDITYDEDKMLYSKLMEIASNEEKFDDFPNYKKSPRILFQVNEEKIEIKKPQNKKTMSKGVILQSIAPALGMVAFTIVLGLFLKRGAYVLMSAGMSIMTAVFSLFRLIGQRKEYKEFNTKRDEKYRAYLNDIQNRICEKRREEKQAYLYHRPNVKQISKMVEDYSSRLYERNSFDADFLELSVGSYRKTSCVKVTSSIDSLEITDDLLCDEARAIVDKYQDTITIPYCINLKNSHLGLVGSRENIRKEICNIVSKLTFFHSYYDMQIVLICEGSDRKYYEYMKWYPHLRLQMLNFVALISDEQMVNQIMGSIHQILKDRYAKYEENQNDTIYLPHLVFIVDSIRLINNHAIMEYLQKEGQALGFSIIYTSDKQENLLENIKTIISIDNAKEATVIIDEGNRENIKLQLDSAKEVDFEKDARIIASITHEKGLSSKIPESITFFDMYGINKPDELNSEIRWKRNEAYKSLEVPLGLRAKDDVVKLNLHEKAHGPHGLVAGTTGSGKSEIIQSYILSLAVNFHPTEVGFLLIDYKGGGMANLFESLPHLLGTITNLDKTESMRALVSIKSELKRRQKLFGENGVNHINGYNLLYREGKTKEPLPHLFIISDEFAELKKEQPEFMAELVSAARIGRSLGVHLILATQKPTGVVDDQIWTNSRFKLCLKVQNASDSNEMLHTPDAASIVNSGRAYLQVGNNEVYEMFQSAWSGEIYSSAEKTEREEDNRVYIVNRLGQGELINKDLSGNRDVLTSKATQLDVTVEYLKHIYDKEKESKDWCAVKKPWLPPLEHMLINPRFEDKVANPNESDLCMTVGVVDIPSEQMQQEVDIDLLRDGNCLYVASSGYGKSVFLTNCILDLASKNNVDNVNFYILDFGNNALMPLAELPHCSAHIMLDDAEKLGKFLSIIEGEIKERKRLFASKYIQNYEMYLQTQQEPLRAIVIAIDNYDAIREMGYDMEEIFTKFSREGVGLGIYIIATANRLNSIRSAAVNNYKIKIAGVNFDESEVRAVVGKTEYALPDIKGRAMIKTGDYANMMQLYSPYCCQNGAEYVAGIKRIIFDIRAKADGKEARHIPILPDEFTLPMLNQFVPFRTDDVFVGLESSSVEKIGMEYSNSPFLILGDSTSGKTNVLKIMLSQVQGEIIIIDSRSRGLFEFSDKSRYLTTQSDIEIFSNELSDICRSRETAINDGLTQGKDYTSAVRELDRIAIVIDDLGNMLSVLAESAPIVTGRIRKAISVGITVIVSENPANFKGIDDLTKELKQTKNGLLLSDQGYHTVFPIKPSESPMKPDGILMTNGKINTVRIPSA